MGSTIFVIDSSPAVHRMVEQLSMPDGHTVRGFHDGPSALEAARAQSPALIIADYHLEKITFSGFCKEIGRQENLAETLIVSMVDAADRLDESKLRSLGVRTFLKKPFQREQLLDTIKSILSGTAGRPSAKPAKARTWPPVSTGTDDEYEQESPLETAAEEAPLHAREKDQATMPPSSSTQPVSASISSSSRSKGEELLKDLVDHLLHSTTVHADKSIANLLPGAIAKEVAGQLGTALSKAVRAEVSKQVSDALEPELGDVCCAIHATLLRRREPEVNERIGDERRMPKTNPQRCDRAIRRSCERNNSPRAMGDRVGSRRTPEASNTIAARIDDAESVGARRGRARGHDGALIVILRGAFEARLGMRRSRTPELRFALIASASTLSGSENVRLNAP